MSNPTTLIISDLLDSYRAGRQTPGELMERLLEKSAADDARNIWIARLSRDQVMAYVNALDPRAIDDLPLYGIPFVVKDNIDLAGVPTTAGCPSFAYTPPHSASVVQKLIDAGAIPLGKTNLDQFATGLVGARSPYGACRNSFNPDYVSGGSSSGSAVAVAAGLASFSLGTDTAGSGRVPAAFNNIVGLKPSNGRLSTRGVVPACRSLDCVSIFALTAEDAARVLDVAEGFDAADPYSRRVGHRALPGLRFGVPRPDQLQFFGDVDYQQLFDLAVRQFEELGGKAVEIDFAPFLDAARLLYEGPWIAERYAAVGSFIDAHPEGVHPVTRQIVEAGKKPTAAAAFQGAYQLKQLERLSESAWSQVDMLFTPTAGTIYRIADVAADPIRLNANLGFYTNFMNLFDLAGVAVPAGFRADGMPFGVTLVGPRATDHALLEVAARLHSSLVATVGALDTKVAAQAAPRPSDRVLPRLRQGYVAMAVCGAHMEGLPLNHQLRDRGAYLLQATSTAPRYRLFALPGGPPRRPGMIRVNEDGAAIGLEVWALPTEEVGSFVAGIPAPLGVGKVELASGELVTGFVCEGYAAPGAADISSYGGWREYL
ncbi:MAG: allophanate hydrolase, partial [Pseudomonadota bacterium]|nr:allophanate hydrolase [Pseudomonadota bacterium]